jgi:alpha-N-arabinofuranosidase
MKQSLAQKLRCLVVVMACGARLSAQSTAQLTIDTTKTVHAVSPMLYGLMTEEINHSYEGGLYAELLSNNTFRGGWMGVEGWGLTLHGNAQAGMGEDAADGPSAALPKSLKVTVSTASAGNEAGVSNPGYWGIAVRPHMVYRGSLYAKADAGVGPLTARLVADDTGKVLASAQVALHGDGWSQYEFALTTGDVKTSSANHFELTVAHTGTLHVQLVSLMPPTYNDRANGLRPDLMERMAAMHPKFLRLPGGNYLEGDTLADWYDWKKTIGPLVDRPGHQAPWSYWSTDGLGLLEFLEWCEDLKVEPVLAVYAGYSLRGEHVAVGKDLEPYVQSAVDEVEYVTGDAGTKWGAERAKDGHPKPFPLSYIEIGNEDMFDKSGSYDARWTQFAKALREKYPQYKLIATTKVKTDAEPDVIDDHYYESPAEMFRLVHKYDDAPRNQKIFVGEWATRSGSPTPNMGDALGDAAWMTGLERNSDVIVMASYAPLLVNVNPGALQWPTDLIGFNAMKSYGSPSYYAQCLFAAHLGGAVVQSSIAGAGPRFFYSATKSGSVLHLKLVNASDKPQELSLEIAGAKRASPTHVIAMWSLHGGSFEATNSITEPEKIVPVMSHVVLGKTHTVPAYTIEVLDVPLQ